MKTKEAIKYFESLMAGKSSDSELKVYERFIDIFNELDGKELKQEQLDSLEKKIAGLQLKATSDNKSKYLNKKLGNLKKFLKSEFSFITKGHYSRKGMMYGLFVGVLLGVFLEEIFGVPIAVGLGLVGGMLVGVNMDSHALKKGRVLETTSS